MSGDSVLLDRPGGAGVPAPPGWLREGQRTPSVLEVLLKGGDVVGVLLEPRLGGLLLLALAILVRDEVLEAVVLLVVELEVLQHVRDLGEVVAEAIASDHVQVLRLAVRALGILQGPDGERSIGPEGLP